MSDDMVMRSVYLRPVEDAQLRQLAHELNVTKSDLIRSAISVKLGEWLKSSDRERILQDVEHGRRDEAAIRSGRRGRQGPSAAIVPPVATAVEAPAAQAELMPPPAESRSTGAKVGNDAFA